MSVVETQWDAVIGPTHHYAGLSHGNVASARSAQQVSHPKQAALQGLDKMRLVASLGVPQYVLPPQPRPNMDVLAGFGFAGSVAEQLKAAAEYPKLLSAAYSASSMWSANMATVAPAVDAPSGRLQFTPANLVSTLHRPQEAAWNHALLRYVWDGAAEVHAPLLACAPMADEGAANHMRLCGAHGDVGVHIFVYGRAEGCDVAPKKFPARQTLASCEALARLHGLDLTKVVMVQQHPDAIDAGVFHNDVIAMSNQNVLIYHEKAFVDTQGFLAAVRSALAPVPLLALEIKEADLSLADAVSSYFFNSQLLTLPDGSMAVIAPKECEENHAAYQAFSRLVQSEDNPIVALHFPNVRESMKNGGGPACLRLRVAGDEANFPERVQRLRWNEALDARLRTVIAQHYPEEVTIQDLTSEDFMMQVLQAQRSIMDVLNIPYNLMQF